MARKNKKRRHSRTVDLKRQMQQEKLADEKSRAKNRWNPAGRALLWGDLIFLAAVSLLEANDLISQQVGVLCTVISVVLLLIALCCCSERTTANSGRALNCKKD